MTTSYDKFQGTTTESVQLNRNTIPRSDIRLVRVGTEGQQPVYALLAAGYFNTGGRQGPARPNELAFLLDGQPLRVKGGSSVFDVSAQTTGVYYKEQATFPLTAAQIERIADAQVVELRLYAENGSFEGGTIAPDIQDAIRRFRDLFVRRDWDRMNETERQAAVDTRE